jgi:hypothetical protein
MSGAGLEWCCVGFGAPFAARGFGLGLKHCFPLVGTLGHEWAPERTPKWGETEWSTWSEAESCAGGLSWHNRPVEGKLN